MEFAKEYTSNEMMAVVCAKELNDSDVVFVGIGMPQVAALIASKTHARDITIVYEAGGVGAKARRIPWSISDNPTTENAIMATSMWSIFSDTQRGFINKGIIGGAQIDKYGNLNTTVIMAGQSYETPKVRLPGSGGANDISSSCNEVVVMMGLKKDNFVEKVDYITTPGFLTGPGEREKIGLRGKGPSAVVTNKGVFRFDPETKEMYLDAIYPGVELDEIKSLVQWDLKVSPQLKLLDPPLQSDLNIVKEYDPKGILLGSKSVTGKQDFDEYYNTLVECYENVVLEL
jgi:glutaconate CoA-transferase subunit B